MKILITGVAGFIGSNLTQRLLEEGHEVIGIDNFITGSTSNIDDLNQYPRFQFMEHDVIEPIHFISGTLDWVMHFASPASPPKYMDKAIETLRVNSEGTMHLLKLCMEKDAQFFYSSTSEVYGDPLVFPQVESYWGNVNSFGERSCYDEAKRYAEAMIYSVHKKYGVPIRVIRIFNTYGPRMDLNDGRVITNFIKQIIEGEAITIYGEGKQTRSFMYIDDLIEGILRMMKVDYQLPVNLGNQTEHKIIDLVDIFSGIVGKELTVNYMPLPKDDPNRRNPDITVAMQLLDWKPVIRIEQGIIQTMEYFKNRKYLKRNEEYEI